MGSGYHGGKKVAGRGRRVAVDTQGWLLGLVVTAAFVSDRAGAKLLVIRLLDAIGTLKIMWADSGYDGKPMATWIKAVAAITWKWSSAPTRTTSRSSAAAGW